MKESEVTLISKLTLSSREVVQL